MALTLPSLFKDDIQARDTNLIPVVIIGNYPSGGYSDTNNNTWLGSSLHISTNDFTHPAGQGAGTNLYKVHPILLNIPSLKESIDIEKRKYKISNITLDISNLPHGDERFSEMVGNDSLINTEVRIFWWSSSTELINANPDYADSTRAFLIYNGTIRRYTHDDEKVRLAVEDHSQATLHKDLPLSDAHLATDDIILDKYKNKPIPMVYGYVDRSPCVIDTSGGSNIIRADNVEIETLGLFVNREEIYLDVPEEIVYPFDSHSLLEGTSNIPKQWVLHGNDYELQNTILLQNKLLQVQYIGVPHNLAIRVHEPDAYVPEPSVEVQGNLLTEDNIENIIGSGSYTSPEINIYCSGETSAAFYTALPSPPFSMACTYLEISNGLNIDSEDEIIIGATVNGYDLPGYLNNQSIFGNLFSGITLFKGMQQQAYSWQQQAYSGIATTYIDLDDPRLSNMENLFHIGYYEDNSDNSGEPYDILSFGNSGAAFRSLGWNTLNPESGDETSKFVLHISGGTYRIYIGFSHKSVFVGSVQSTSHEQYSLDSINVHTVHDIKNPLKENFYANVIGRKNIYNYVIADSPQIIAHIISGISDISNESIVEQASLDGVYDNYPLALWEYAFTVDKKINSKKLIEGIASASPYIPRFDNMGNFKFDMIPKTIKMVAGEGEVAFASDMTIKEADVIDFSFSRTKIEDVYTKVVFKYNWDYARGEFNSSVIADRENIGQNIVTYNYDHYGFPDPIPIPDTIPPEYTHPDSTLVIDDDRGKYIRKPETAQRFAEWYMLWSCNQHLKMKVKLPLKYMNLEIGDIVRFDSILGGVKPYGIDYSEDANFTIPGFVLDSGATAICYGDIVNGQQVFPDFMCISTNKSLQYVETEFIQLHQLSDIIEIDAIYGVTNPDAWNYRDDASISYGTPLLPPTTFETGYGQGANTDFDNAFLAQGVCPYFTHPDDPQIYYGNYDLSNNDPEDQPIWNDTNSFNYDDADSMEAAKNYYLAGFNKITGISSNMPALYSLSQCQQANVIEHDFDDVQMRVDPNGWTFDSDAPTLYMLYENINGNQTFTAQYQYSSSYPFMYYDLTLIPFYNNTYAYTNNFALDMIMEFAISNITNFGQTTYELDRIEVLLGYCGRRSYNGFSDWVDLPNAAMREPYIVYGDDLPDIFTSSDLPRMQSLIEGLEIPFTSDATGSWYDSDQMTFEQFDATIWRMDFHVQVWNKMGILEWSTVIKVRVGIHDWPYV